jgi:hypothetical protein
MREVNLTRLPNTWCVRRTLKYGGVGKRFLDLIGEVIGQRGCAHNDGVRLVCCTALSSSVARIGIVSRYEILPRLCG